MKVIKISEVMNRGLLYFYYSITAFAILTLILYISMYLVSPTREIGIALASVFCMNGLLFTGWMIRKYWKEDNIPEYKADRYLWLGITCGLTYVCLQMLDSGLWLWIPSCIALFFYALFIKDEIRTFLDWKRNVKITWN